MHVHFHIIPKFDDAGLGLKWNARTLDNEAAQELSLQIKVAMDT